MGVRKNLRRINWDHVTAIDTLIRSERPQGTLNLPRGVIVKKTYDTLFIDKEAPFQPDPFHYVLKGPGRVYLKETNQTLSLSEISPESLNKTRRSIHQRLYTTAQKGHPHPHLAFQP